MPYPIVGTLNIEGKKHSLVVDLQSQTCCIYKVPEGPLSVAGAMEHKRLV